MQDVLYQDVCNRNTKNPILVDSNYLGRSADYKISAVYAHIHLGPDAVNFQPSGKDVQVIGVTRQERSSFGCGGKFVPMPYK